MVIWCWCSQSFGSSYFNKTVPGDIMMNTLQSWQPNENIFQGPCQVGCCSHSFNANIYSINVSPCYTKHLSILITQALRLQLMLILVSTIINTPPNALLSSFLHYNASKLHLKFTFTTNLLDLSYFWSLPYPPNYGSSGNNFPTSQIIGYLKPKRWKYQESYHHQNGQGGEMLECSMLRSLLRSKTLNGTKINAKGQTWTGNCATSNKSSWLVRNIPGSSIIS